MASPKSSDPKSNYGSCRSPNKHLHASLESLDVGLRASRSSHSSLPQDASFAPLLRKLSLQISPDKEEALTLSSDHNPSLNTPILNDTGITAEPTMKKKDVPVEQKKESKNISDHTFPYRSSPYPFLTLFLSPTTGAIYIIVYALVNSIMCVPCLYGYASVIFSHSIYQPHINALSKLVILSSVVHQFCFSIFSSLPFSIGQVQDAGLIFLSAMSHRIATSILANRGDSNDDDVMAEILSTTIVLLGLGTASLGLVLILAGKFRLADAVAYLPLPGECVRSATMGFMSFQLQLISTAISYPFSCWRIFGIHWVFLLRSRGCFVHWENDYAAI